MKAFPIVAAALLGAAWTAPAIAQQVDWRHPQSGIRLEGDLGGMQPSRERDLSDGAGLDVYFQLGTNDEMVTFYVYRSAYPNAALWYERTRHAMALNVGSGSVSAEPRQMSLGGANVNGLREEFDLPAGGPFRSTAVAIAHAGEWMVKIRISSASLGREEVAAKMDRLIAAVRLPEDAPTAARPLTVPAPCASSTESKARQRQRPSSSQVAAAAVGGIEVLAEARGHGGLAAEPSAWCRVASNLPTQIVSAYRHQQTGAWVVLVGDSGRAVAARALEPGGRNAAVYVSSARSTGVAGLYDGLPGVDEAVAAAIPVVAGQAPPLAEVSLTQKGGGRR
ncbi:MAG: hypothetical protein ACK4K7_03365 [Allosphingosinicella sp.]|uniref:hypothetical protein n=1 Tax=Allosphingosinicella sp. TaxID=2823234 RepID=UPI00395759FD